MSTTKMYWIKKIPTGVKEYFTRKFPPLDGFTFDFYCYYNCDKTIKYFGCYVAHNGQG